MFGINSKNGTFLSDSAQLCEMISVMLGDNSAYRPLPKKTDSVWYNSNGLYSVEKCDTRLVLKLEINNNYYYDLYVSFPKEGGIRLYSQIEGFHKPETQKNITYTQADDELVMTAGDSQKVILKQKNRDWMLDIYNNESYVYSISGKQIFFGFNTAGHLAQVRFEGDIGEDEVFVGLGERFDSIVRNGTYSLLWNYDTLRELANPSDDVERIYTYTNIPFLLSTYGYSFFLNSSYAIEADMGKKNAKKYSLEAYGPTLDIFFWAGDMKQCLEYYCDLTGYNILPPKWALSYWAGNSAEYWKRSNNGDYMFSLKEMMDGYGEIGTPIKTMFVEGVIYRDEEIYKFLNKTNTRVIAWHDSGYYRKDIIETLIGEEAPVVKPYFDTEKDEISQKYIDFTNPLSAKVLEASFGKYLEYGTKGAMIDFADGVPYNSVFSNGMTGDEMHNLYAYYYQKAFKELYENHHGDDYLLFARAGFAGTQSLMTKFLGDQDCTFMGLQQAYVSGLNLSLSGFSNWGSDMGALGEKAGSMPDEDLYRRWLQWSAFNPIMRSHGHTTRGPWDYGKAAVKDFRKYYWIRENLLDLIYSNAIECSRCGRVMAEPLMLAFPNEAHLNRVENEYLFCDEILVAPVLTEMTTVRDVTLPYGNWTCLNSGKILCGGKTHTVKATQDIIPLYLCEGTVIPVKVSENLLLGDSMEKGEKIDALLVTAANDKREIIFNTNKDSQVEFESLKVKDGTTKIVSQSDFPARAIIAKGISAACVLADGVALAELENIKAGAQAGFTVDRVENTTTIWLPEGFESVEITDGGKQLKNLVANLNTFAVSKNPINNSNNVTCSDPTLSWKIRGGNDYIVIYPENEITFDQVRLSWGFCYADSYTVEISQTEAEWEIVHTVSGGLGGEEILHLENAAKAKFIRLANFSNARGVSSELLEIRVFGKETE